MNVSWKDFVKDASNGALEDGFSVSVPQGWPQDSSGRIRDVIAQQIDSAPATNTAPTQSDIDEWVKEWPKFRKYVMSVYDGKDVNEDLSLLREQQRLRFHNFVKWKDYAGFHNATNDIPQKLDTMSATGKKLLFDDYANATNLISKIKAKYPHLDEGSPHPIDGTVVARFLQKHYK